MTALQGRRAAFGVIGGMRDRKFMNVHKGMYDPSQRIDKK